VSLLRHRELAEAVGADLARRTDVLAVLITGSVGRGDHVPASDVDLLVVTADDHTLEPTRRLCDGLLVEWGARSEAEWLERFDRPKSSWLYPFLEGQVIFDSGPAARLIEAARDTRGRRKPLGYLLAIADGLGESTGEFGRRGTHLPDVNDVLRVGEDVGAVGVEPEGLSAVVARRDELTVVESGTVGEGDTHAATFEVDELGHDISGHGSVPPGPNLTERTETGPLDGPPRRFPFYGNEALSARRYKGRRAVLSKPRFTNGRELSGLPTS
jgi:predicted nucleotidyltransferase